MTGKDLKNSILQLAIQGKLVEQREEEGTAKELLKKIEAEKKQLVKEGKIKKQKKLPEISEDEKLFDIPESWEWVRFSDVVNIVSARRVHQSDWKNEGIPFYRAREIGKLAEYGFVDNDLYIDETQFSKFSESGVPKSGDLMVTAVGTLGKTYIVKEHDKFYYKDASVICLENFSRTNPKYLKYIMDSKMMEQQIRSNSGGTTVATLTMVRMNKYVFPLPPLEEQKRIVAKIEELMFLVKKYDQVYSEVEELNKKFPENMQKSILQYAIQGKLVEQREEEGTAEELYKHIQEEKKKLIKEGKIRKIEVYSQISDDEIPYDIPQSWKWVRLIDLLVVKPTNGFSPKGVDYETRVKNLTLTATTSGIFKEAAYKYVDIEIDDKSPYWLKQNDLLIQRSNSREYVGTSCVYTGKDNAFIYPDLMMRMRLHSKTLVRYVDLVLKAPYSRKYFTESASGTSASMPKINQGTVSNSIIPLPPLEEQKRIVEKINELLPYTKQLVR